MKIDRIEKYVGKTKIRRRSEIKKNKKSRKGNRRHLIRMTSFEPRPTGKKWPRKIVIVNVCLYIMIEKIIQKKHGPHKKICLYTNAFINNKFKSRF